MLTNLILFMSFFILPQATFLYDSTQFTDFIRTYDKNYSDDELLTRLEIFKSNLDKINKHNNEEHTWKMSLNKFADLTSVEFKNLYTGYNKPALGFRRSGIKFDNLDAISIEDLPDEVDWVSAGAVTGVKDQSQCGSCYSFSGIEAVESSYFLKTGKLLTLSEQQVVDCSDSYGDQGCNGGTMDAVFQYIIDNGICLEKDYPYKGVDGTCKKCSSVLKIDSFVDVTPNSEIALQQAVVGRPIAIAIEADQTSFQFYSSGVLTSNCGTNLDHGTELVGYGTLNGIDYWKVRNSWGSSWGMDGYILLARNVKQKGGQCGITQMASYPVFKSEKVIN